MTAADFLPISGWDHVEFYVGNARQAAHFYEKTFGFEPVAKVALETGSRDRASYVLKQGDIRFVFTSALVPDHEIARHCQLHGDGVKTIALTVRDCDAAMKRAVGLGGAVLYGPLDVPGAGRLAGLQDPGRASFTVMQPAAAHEEA